MARCFLFKPDGIGDFFLSSGVVRLMAKEYGEENLVITVLPPLESVIRGQFPKATPVVLPLRKNRVILNVFVANLLRCLRPWMMLMGTKVDVSISLRHMRDYFQNVLFFSVRSKKRLIASNLLLGNRRPVRRWTEKAFIGLFRPMVIEYPTAGAGVPSELEVNRLLAGAALGRNVSLEEIWPQLKSVNLPPVVGPYWVCAPFSSSLEKDFPEQRWIEIFQNLKTYEKLPQLVLTGSRDQLGSLEAMRDHFKNSGFVDAEIPRIVLPENLQSFIDLLAGASCVLTVDTAAAHAATALDRRTVILFSGLHQGMFAPWNRSSRQKWILPKHGGEGEWHSIHTNEQIVTEIKATLQAP